MSQYYNSQRGRGLYEPGSKEPFKISRSKIDLFLECPRCFYYDRKLGVGRPPGFPFTLNAAVDALLKLEFDVHRANGTKHPLIEKYGIDARPVSHEDLAQWRHNGCKVSDTGYFVYCNGIADAKAFDQKLEFRVNLIPYTGDESWVEKTIFDMHKCLNGDKIPEASSDCDYCSYISAINNGHKNQ